MQQASAITSGRQMNWVDVVLQGRTIRWFLAVVALYLTYQIWLNAKFFGTEWVCWDYMLISGFLAFIVAIWLASGINRRLDTAIDRLRLNNALVITGDGISRLKQQMASQGKGVEVWSGLLIGLLIFGSYVWVFGGLSAQIWQAWRQGTLPQGGVALAELGIFTAISALSAALAGLFFGRLTHYGTLAGVLSTHNSGLRITPGHFDGVCGLKPIGDFYLFQAVLLAIPILWLGAWWAWIIPNYKDITCTLTGQPQFLFREWQGPFFIQWLVVLGYFYTGFVRPFLTLRRRIRTKKASLIREDAAVLEQEIYELQGQLVSDPGGPRANVVNDIDSLSRRLWSIRTMPDWPMDPLTLAKYRSLLAGEVLLPLGAAALTSTGVGTNSFELQWFQSWLGSLR